MIDVKGMKAMGNRLSQHPVKKVELLNELNPEAEITEAQDNNVEDLTTDNIPEPDEASELSEIPALKPEKEKPAIQSTEPAKSVESPPDKSVQSSQDQPMQSQPKKIDFEITNPDDIEIDDKGQLG